MSSWVTITTPKKSFTVDVEAEVDNLESLVRELEILQVASDSNREGFAQWWLNRAYPSPFKDEAGFYSPASIAAFYRKLAAEYAWEAGRLYERMLNSRPPPIKRNRG